MTPLTALFFAATKAGQVLVNTVTGQLKPIPKPHVRADD